MKRTTIFLPDALHDRLREEAFRAKTSMAELIRSRLEIPAEGIRKRRNSADPLLKVAGICRDPGLSADIDDQLYGR
jgi:hypothetical protein